MSNFSNVVNITSQPTSIKLLIKLDMSNFARDPFMVNTLFHLLMRSFPELASNSALARGLKPTHKKKAKVAAISLSTDQSYGVSPVNR